MAEVSFLAKHFSVDQKTIRKCLEQTSSQTGQSKKKVLEIVSESLAPGLGLGDLPTELLFEISLKHLPVEDILRFCQTSREFKALCDSNFVWKRLLQRDFGVDFEGEDAKKEYQRLKDNKGLQKLAVGRGSITMIDGQGHILLWGAYQTSAGPKVLKGVERLQVPSFAEQVSSSGWITAIVHEGEVYTWGYFGHYIHAVGKEVGVGVFKHDFQEKVRQISVGDKEFGLITQEGDAWVSRDSGGDWTRVSVRKAKQISCSSTGRHSGVVTTGGKLYMWGEGKNGQLGRRSSGKHLVPASSPLKVPFPAKIKIRSVSCGWRHTGAVTTEGDLYMWGLNSHGQIGDGTTIQAGFPKRILRGVKQVTCGKNHTGAITTEGLYMWGNNEVGQLGFDSGGRSQLTPSKVVFPEEIIEVACSDHLTGVITKSRKVYAWGYAIWKPSYHYSVADYRPHYIADL